MSTFYIKTKDKILMHGDKRRVKQYVSEYEAEQIKLTHKYKLTIYPDNDCYNYTKEFDVDLFELKLIKY